jgi:hypothetical protein
MRFASLVVFAELSLSAAGLRAQQAQPAQQGQSDLAQSFLNPVTNVINLSFENNVDFGQDSARTTYTGDLKPVIPFRLSPRWSVITRTVVPFVSTWSPDGGGGRTFGVGDIVGTVLLSPERAASGSGGEGPVLIFPSATNRAIGGGQWSAGPSVGMMRQVGGWSITMAIAHPWSFAGDPRRPRLSCRARERYRRLGVPRASRLPAPARAPPHALRWTGRRDEGA